MVLLLILGCLERTEEGLKPLDERFTELPSGVGANADGGTSMDPFSDYEGEKVKISGTVTSESAQSVDMDFRAPAPDEEAGKLNLGKIALAEPGPWELEVPLSYGALLVEGFQDLALDGPTPDDPYAWLEVNVGSEPIEGLDLLLEVGGLEEARAAASASSDPFGDHEGPWVSLSGSFSAPGSERIQLDLRSVEGQSVLGKWVIPEPGDYSMKLPADLGEVQLQAFQDLEDDGPTDDDPFGYVMIEIGSDDLGYGEVSLVAGGKLLLAQAMGHSEHKGAEAEAPFADYEGEWVEIAARVTSAADGEVSVDLRIPDVDAPGGNRRLGGVGWDGPGEHTLKVPVGLGMLVLEVFQDLEGDGPSAADPYSSVELEVKSKKRIQIDVPLVAGSRGQPTGGGGGTVGGSLFPGLDEDGLQVSGTIRLAEGVVVEGLLDLDVFTSDAEAPGGRRYVGKLKVEPGAFTFRVPLDLSALEMEVFLDADADGPTPGDAFGACSCNPLKLNGKDVEGLEILVKVSG